MSQWIDFKQLRAKLKLSEVLDHYKVVFKVKGDQAQGFCPLPGHKGERRSPSFSFNLSRGIWQCFGCGAKGNVLDFAIRMEGLSPDKTADVRTIALRLQKRFHIDCVAERRPSAEKPSQSGNTEGVRRRQARSPAEDHPLLASVAERAPPTTAPTVRINEPLDFELKGLQPNHPYLPGRGFSPQTVAHFGLGFCARGLMAGRIVIPLHDTSGQLVGYAGRIVDDSAICQDVPKYKFPGNRERHGVVHEFHKSHLLYNASRIKQPVDHLVVVEGFPSVWWLHQAGIENVVALMGSSCSPEQAAIIFAKTTPTARISILPDGDEAGERCAQRLFAAVGPHRWVRWVQLLEGNQPTACRQDELVHFFPA